MKMKKKMPDKYVVPEKDSHHGWVTGYKKAYRTQKAYRPTKRQEGWKTSEWRMAFLDCQQEMADVIEKSSQIMQQCSKQIKATSRAYQEELEEIRQEAADLVDAGYEEAYKMLTEYRIEIERLKDKLGHN